MDQHVDNPYLRDAVLTATPEQLQLMLYDGAIRYALQGRDALEQKDYEKALDKLTRAQHIIIEMINGLNHDVNPELCERVAAIYNFLYRKLVDACVRRSTECIDEALRVLRIERETWQILVDKVNRIREGGEASGPEQPAPAGATQARSNTTSHEPVSAAEVVGFSVQG
jgi:flagellar secretion chaperone FliS